MNPKISVVTVCYNAEKDIEETILSVISQTYSNIEYIIVDGASKDGTMDIVNKYRDKISIIVSEPDRGIFDAMNKGIRLATGDWINFMNVGDTFYNERVLLNAFSDEIDDNIGVIFGDCNTEKGIMEMIPFIEHPNSLSGMGICHQAIFAKTELAKKYPFEDGFKVAADYRMIRNIYDAGFSFKQLHFPICNYDLYGFSANNSLRQLDEERLICHKSVFNITYLYRRFKLIIKRIIK